MTARLGFARIGVCLVALAAGWLRAEPPAARPVVQKDFRVFDYYRGSQKPKALLRGGEAEYLLNPIPMRRVTIETYTETGLTNLIAKCDTSFCNRSNRTAYSAGPLEFRLSEGRFRLSGWGYFWSQTNTHLIVSNQVRSVLKGELLSHPMDRP
ncbi:MAG: hypothetical protein HY299_06755 [Verrucomicrobia bacterium]|nr:hypothetical protein [Verrucomicrobiota bacterium]